MIGIARTAARARRAKASLPRILLVSLLVPGPAFDLVLSPLTLVLLGLGPFARNAFVLLRWARGRDAQMELIAERARALIIGDTPHEDSFQSYDEILRTRRVEADAIERWHAFVAWNDLPAGREETVKRPA